MSGFRSALVSNVSAQRESRVPQTRQRAPNNHVLDLVVICMLSLLRMSLSHVALSLFGYVRSLFRFVLRPGQVTPPYTMDCCHDKP